MVTVSDVAKHDDRGSCWIIVEGHVYDVTDFIAEHPGGPELFSDMLERYLTECFTIIALE